MANYYAHLDQRNRQEPENTFLSYEEAKEIFSKAKDPAKGRRLKGDTKILRAKNGNFVITHFPRSGNYYYNRKNEPVPLFTIMPGDKFVIHVTNPSESGYALGDAALFDRLLQYTPLQQDGYYRHYSRVKGLAPSRKTKPRLRKVKGIPQPNYVPPDHWNAETRKRYEDNLATYGDMDAWHKAYTKDLKVEQTNEQKLREWGDSEFVRAFSGMVVTSDGVVSQRSIDRHESALRGAEKKEKTEVRRREQEKLRQQNANAAKAYKWLRDKGVKNVQKINPITAQWLYGQKLVPSKDGKTVILSKAVRSDYMSAYDGRTAYTVGAEVVAEDYDPSRSCGQGLHFSAKFSQAQRYVRSATIRHLKCEVPVNTIIVIQDYQPATADKVKAKSCKVLEEVKRDAIRNNW
jgi:hypothetical protein